MRLEKRLHLVAHNEAGLRQPGQTPELELEQPVVELGQTTRLRGPPAVEPVAQADPVHAVRQEPGDGVDLAGPEKSGSSNRSNAVATSWPYTPATQDCAQ